MLPLPLRQCTCSTLPGVSPMDTSEMSSILGSGKAPLKSTWSQGTLDSSFKLGEPQNAWNGGEHTQWKGYILNAAVQIKMRCVCITHGLPDTHLIHFTYLPALAHSKAHTELQISYQRPKQTAWGCTAISFSPLLVSPPTHILIIS